MIAAKLIQDFTSRFGSSPAYVVRAPGRVNLIGEHTDYNQGLVMPMAIDLAMLMAVGPRNDSQVRIYSQNFGAGVQFELSQLEHAESGWGEYAKGIGWALAEYGHAPKGWEAVLASDIPVGAGLSSSAAFEMACIKAFQLASSFPWEPVKMAQLAQFAENQWIGVNSGIMDPLIVAVGETSAVTLIDCRSLDLEALPLPEGVSVVVIDSGTRRGLADSAYNARREECEQAAEYFGLASLRELDVEVLGRGAPGLSPEAFKRARHVVGENARVLAAAIAMRENDPVSVGRILQEGHASMRDDFEVSREEIDILVAIANALPGCYGARMTGGGFGGCVVALVAAAEAEAFVDAVQEKYPAATGIEAKGYITKASEGVSARAV